MKNDYSWNLDTDYLSHHGVNGMKWGVKNGPPYPLSPAISTGSRLKNTSSGTRPGTTPTPGSDRSQKTAARLSVLGIPASVLLTAATLSLGVFSPVTLVGIPAGAYGLYSLVSGDVKEMSAKKKAKKFEKERQSNPVDEKTGFHLKTSKLSEDEDMERVNPEYKNWDQNTKNNCVMCSLTYDMRRRGYDVTAKTSLQGINTFNVAKECYKNADKNTERFHEVKSYKDISRSTEESNTIKLETYQYIKTQPEGSRGMLSIGWNGTLSGHCLAYEVKNNEVYIIDSQSNERYPFNKIDVEINQAGIIRTDNLEPNYDAMKEYMR